MQTFSCWEEHFQYITLERKFSMYHSREDIFNVLYSWKMTYIFDVEVISQMLLHFKEHIL